MKSGGGKIRFALMMKKIVKLFLGYTLTRKDVFQEKKWLVSVARLT